VFCEDESETGVSPWSLNSFVHPWRSVLSIKLVVRARCKREIAMSGVWIDVPWLLNLGRFIVEITG